MPIVVEERADSRGGTDQGVARVYDVYGSQDEVAVLNAVRSKVPVNLSSQFFQRGITLDEANSEDNTGGHYVVTVNYEPAQEATSDYRFSFQAPAAHIYQSLATISSTVASGSAPDFQGAINVVNDGGNLRCEGYNIAIPPETFTLAYYPVNGVITANFEETVESLAGLVNSVSYKGRPAGSLMLTRVTGGSVNGKAKSIEFGFASIQNRTSVPVGSSITVAAKDGMDLLWPYYEDDIDGTANQLIKKPTAAFVERIFYRGDFAALGL